jgi:hypothetical protein
VIVVAGRVETYPRGDQLNRRSANCRLNVWR